MMKKWFGGKERLTNIIDGVFIIIVIAFLCLKFVKTSFFLVVVLVSIPFLIYALKIIFIDGILSK